MSFFVCQAEPPEETPDRAGIDRHTTLRFQTRRHFIERDITLGIHLRAHPILMRRQFSKARIALTFRRKGPCLALQPDHFINEFDRDIEPLSRRMVCIACLNMRHNALPKFHWMRFAHIDRPCLFQNKESRLNTKVNPESD